MSPTDDFSIRPLEQPGRFAFERLHHYPHLASKEVLIWDRFVRLNSSFAERADYDIICGESPPIPDSTPEHTRKDWKYLAGWKIDVVAYKGGIAYVIEVRPRAGLGAIGETLSKAIMWQQDHPLTPEVEPVLITDIERPNMRALCAEHDIGYIVV